MWGSGHEHQHSSPQTGSRPYGSVHGHHPLPINKSRTWNTRYHPIADFQKASGISRCQELLQECHSKNSHYLDEEFPPGSSMWINVDQKQMRDNPWPNLEWVRALTLLNKSEYCVFESVTPNDMRQGQILDGHLLCSISILAEQPDLVKRLFTQSNPNDQGVYSVWLFIEGNWREVVMDDYLPVFQVGNGVEFAFSRHIEDQLWVTLLEKAFAKTHGGYMNIQSGDPLETLRELTGSPYTLYDTSSLEVLWKTLDRSLGTNGLVVCVPRLKAGRPQVEGLAYSVLNCATLLDSSGGSEKVVMIRMPWGEQVRPHRWGKEDPNWNSNNRQTMGYQNYEDGSVCFSLSDFATMFGTLAVYDIQPAAFSGDLKIELGGPSDYLCAFFDIAVADKYTISIDQPTFPTLYLRKQAAPIRVVVAKMFGNSFELIQVKIGTRFSTFVTEALQPGRYLVLCDLADSPSPDNPFVISVQGPQAIPLDQAQLTKAQFDCAYYEVFKGCLTSNIIRMDKLQNIPVDQNNLKCLVSRWRAQDPLSGLTFHCFKMEDGNADLKLILNPSTSQGVDVISALNEEGRPVLLIPRMGIDIFIVKVHLGTPNFAYNAGIASMYLDNSGQLMKSRLAQAGGIGAQVLPFHKIDPREGRPFLLKRPGKVEGATPHERDEVCQKCSLI